MKATIAAMAMLAFAGCATIDRANNYHGMGVDEGENAIETVEIENSCWLLFKFIPIASGNPVAPNKYSYKLFQNTATLKNNLEMLEDEMERTNAKRVVNLTSRKTDESIFIILFTRSAYHTSAVLLK